DRVRRTRHATPRPQHRLCVVARGILDEDLHLPPEDEEHLFHFVRVGGISLAGRDEHHAEREVLRGNHVRVGLARGSASDEAVLGTAIALDTRIGEGIPLALSIVEPGVLSSEQLLERLRHDYAPHLGFGYGAVIFAYSFGATVTHSLSLTTNTRPPARRFSPAGVNFAPRSCMYILSPVRSCVAAIASRSFFRSVEPARSSESQSTANAVKPPAEVESRCPLKRSWSFCASGFKPGMSASADQLVVHRTLSASLPSAFTYSFETWPPRMPP